jgi:ribosomal protein L11 methyltransferase
MWLSVSLITDAGHAEPLSEALMARGALSVAVEDADAGTEREQPQFGEPGANLIPSWQASRLIALFDDGADGAAIVAASAKEAGIEITPAFTTERVEEQNWVQITQAQFDPIRINDRLWIVPSWHDPPDPAAINIQLDPGMAFGTGSHPTTRLCLDWLCREVGRGQSVLDYGSGSGILAIASAKLGASEVVGVDIDEPALAVAAENARRNRVALRLQHSREPLAAQFDRVVANILTNPLRVLAPLLGSRVKPGGAIALSGVLAAQADEISEVYRPFVPLVIGAELDGWVRLEGRRASC